jgi:hypothetical protein
MQKGGWLQAARARHDIQQDWLDWLRATLPMELRAAVVGVVPRGDELTVLTASASWGTRLRFAMAALAPQLDARAGRALAVKIRVAPSGRS